MLPLFTMSPALRMLIVMKVLSIILKCIYLNFFTVYFFKKDFDSELLFQNNNLAIFHYID